MTQNYGSIDSFDPKESVQNLIGKVRQNLQNIRQITKDLGDLHSIMGGPHDSADKRDKIPKLQRKGKDLVALTTSLFNTISQMKINDEATKLSVSRVKEDFNSVLPKYTEMQEMIMAKLSKMAMEARQSISITLLDRQDSNEQTDLQTFQNSDEVRFAQETEARVKGLERDLMMVQNMYVEINQLVEEQREHVDKIEENIIIADDQVEAGNQQLGQAEMYKTKVVKKKICIAVVILVALLILALIIYFSVKK